MVRGGVVREPGVDLDGDPAVDVAGRLEGGGEQVAGVADVVGGDLPDGVVDVGAAGGELTDLLLVGRAVLERGLEDRRVGGDPDDVLGGDQVLQVAGLQALPGQVVQPEGNPGRGEIGERAGGALRCGHGVFLAEGTEVLASLGSSGGGAWRPGRQSFAVPVRARAGAAPTCASTSGFDAVDTTAGLPAAARDSRAAATTCSGVKPNSRNRVAASAEAP